MSPAQPSLASANVESPIATALSAFGQVEKTGKGFKPKPSGPRIASIIVPIVLVVVLGLAGAFIWKKRRAAKEEEKKKKQALEEKEVV
jgi:hypothetical protein